ncbi:Regulatory protein, RpfE type [Methylophaga frappieri]|uniref:Regulatory protein, RpfE type n=1 Tax=Methylophaga frappieri (strain ATCC BAA-2434 / DSM 25690 / JAM7) TaxID=754477 RepID=I1YLG8_METFJ|nr:Regulatory protein, RpfE type [Methylophaga frappieri]AFJ03761.1 Regulatory protein, RpfE type [Methylophaga frappieri]
MTFNREFSLIWPGASHLFQPLNRLHLPDRLQTLIERARLTENNADVVSLLMSSTSQRPDLPMAKIRFPEETAICADPCYLHADRDRLLMFRQTIQLTQLEMQAIQAALSPLLTGYASSWLTFDSRHWGLRLNAKPDMQCYSPEKLEGKPITDALPQGKDAGKWRRLMNEMQMVLAQHPVNIEREAAGLLPINAVWFSGLDSYIPSVKWDWLLGKNALLPALAKTVNRPYYSDMKTSAKWPSGCGITVLPQVEEQTADPYVELLPWLEAVWRQLRTFQIGTFKLIIPEHGTYSLACWRSWC